MRTVRLLLLLLGASAVAYGGWLLYPQIDTTLPWLVGGPLLHDALVAPLVALAGLTLSRLVTDPVRRYWITAGLVATGTLLLIAVPLTWRPASAPPNPGLQDRDYPLELTTALAFLWIVIMIILILIHVLSRRPAGRSADDRG
ncbi:hypothetical protein I0C86_06975 [Plantactinospora sp. S1510]|uniref:Transmembrane protein n=1 Tax=Plantactinospora alkalitolerans TaxID=2789879 RepID=A0ABS0GRE3_9ACTN|nr:hypothetical protein [Plantactinospora alkalitolerans]MBF9128730.1 hypothetical protein [Plantactinospora alkalitolerans]